MRFNRELAIVAATFTIPAAVGTEIAWHEQKTSRDAAITAKACEQSYPSEVPGAVSKDMLKCMNNGWVPEGRTIYPDISEGDPVELLHGYERIQEARSRHFDKSTVALLGFAGVAAGFFFGAYSEPKRPKRSEPKSRIEPEEDDEYDFNFPPIRVAPDQIHGDGRMVSWDFVDEDRPARFGFMKPGFSQKFVLGEQGAEVTLTHHLKGGKLFIDELGSEGKIENTHILAEDEDEASISGGRNIRLTAVGKMIEFVAVGNAPQPE
jgi:hypothetical protein